MKTTAARKKLSVSRETIRALQDRRLAEAAGGYLQKATVGACTQGPGCCGTTNSVAPTECANCTVTCTATCSLGC